VTASQKRSVGWSFALIRYAQRAYGGDAAEISMPAPSAPQDGDIVIRQDARDGTSVFILHTAPGADQFILHARDAAIAQAVSFAKRQGVRVWLTNGDSEFTLLDNFRVASV
jgi:hypothetical protein